MRYELDGTKVNIYQDGESVPFWYQDCYPNGDEFVDAAEAETWAIAALDSMDPLSGYECPLGRDIPREKKMTPEERLARMAEIKASQ